MEADYRPASFGGISRRAGAASVWKADREHLAHEEGAVGRGCVPRIGNGTGYCLQGDCCDVEAKDSNSPKITGCGVSDDENTSPQLASGGPQWLAVRLVSRG